VSASVDAIKGRLSDRTVPRAVADLHEHRQYPVRMFAHCEPVATASNHRFQLSAGSVNDRLFLFRPRVLVIFKGIERGMRMRQAHFTGDLQSYKLKTLKISNYFGVIEHGYQNHCFDRKVATKNSSK
jgi:hypothetical protein